MLPVLKDVVGKIDKVYHPIGFYIAIPVGELGTQNRAHFYTRVVPKYKEGYGTFLPKEQFVPPTPEQKKLIEEALRPNSERLIGERSKTVAKLGERSFG